MKLENVRVYNIAQALFGMRNPKNSWDRCDTKSGITRYENVVAMAQNSEYDLKDILLYQDENQMCEYCLIGPNDMKLATALKNAGPEHRKYNRQIFVTMDITAPLYWWKEFDTYKVGTVACSTSTMHKLTSKPITLDCFEIGDYDPDLCFFEHEEYLFSDQPIISSVTIRDMVEGEPKRDCWETPSIIKWLEALRLKFIETKDIKYWKELVRWLPTSWLQTRTVTLNYEVLRSMYYQRKDHKLSEWHWFCDRIMDLPYAKELIL